MKPRKPFSFPSGHGYRLVGTPAEIAVDLAVSLEEILAITGTLPAWGRNARLEAVWSMAAVRRALGIPEPPRHRGAPQFAVSIPGARGRRRSQPGRGGVKHAGDVDRPRRHPPDPGG